MNFDFDDMTDDDIFEMQSLLNAEKRRRKDEPKLPVYYTDGSTYKSLDTALMDLKKQIDAALNFKNGGASAYFKASIDGECKKDLLGLKIEFWNESEYNIRPDHVWG